LSSGRPAKLRSLARRPFLVYGSSWRGLAESPLRCAYFTLTVCEFSSIRPLCVSSGVERPEIFRGDHGTERASRCAVVQPDSPTACIKPTPKPRLHFRPRLPVRAVLNKRNKCISRACACSHISPLCFFFFIILRAEGAPWLRSD
jgi:hypothetical protein